MLSALRWAGERPGRGVGQATGRPPSMAHVALQGALPGRRALRRRATLPGRTKRRHQPIGRIPATIDTGRVVDKAPVGCVIAFMQLVGTRGADRRAGHAGAPGLGGPRR